MVGRGLIDNARPAKIHMFRSAPFGKIPDAYLRRSMSRIKTYDDPLIHKILQRNAAQTVLRIEVSQDATPYMAQFR